MSRDGSANLATMLPGGDAGFWNHEMTPANLTGLAPGTASKAAGHALPPTTAMYGDRQQVPWSPDSPTFWVVGLIALTLLGMAGADVRVRLFRRQAAASIGTT